MLRIIVYLVYLLSTLLNVKCEGELLILHSPKAIEFLKADEVTASKLPDIFSSALGFTVEGENTWPGFRIQSPFEFAQAVLVFLIPGIPSLSSSVGNSYPLIMDEDIHDALDEVVENIKMRFPNANVTYEKLDVEKLVLKTYKIFSDYDEIDKSESDEWIMQNEKFSKILTEVRSGLTNMLKEKFMEYVPDVYLVELPNIVPYLQLPGPDRKKLLLEELILLKDRAQFILEGKILIAAVSKGTGESESEEKSSPRSKRESTKDTKTNVTTLESLNVAADYDENFPVIFNIFLWLSVALIFSLIAISMVIAGMDPGRDSIIYRMTSTRMKKDN